MKKNYYIQGDPTRADKIKAAFEKLGINVLDFGFADKTVVYCSIGECVQYLPYSINLMNILYSHPDYQELELPKPHYDTDNFYAGMPVLVRDNDNTQWRYVQFSHCVGKDNPIMFNACGNTWEQCIPFEGNETLLGTTDMCNEKFINW